MSTITYRPIKKSDYQALEQIIRDTWNYDRFCSEKTAKAMAKLYLSSCLLEQDFTCVAEQDGKAVGVIMGKNESSHRKKFSVQMRKLVSILAMYSRKEGRKIAKMFGGIQQLDETLLKSSNRSFAGELSFFAVDQTLRGTGIGKELFQRVLNYMDAEKLRDFYLFTDSSCNYGFYEHHGMRRIAKQRYLPMPFAEEAMEFYLYCYEL